MFTSLPTIRYWIDAQDRIVTVNEDWTRFARENDGDDLIGGKIVGKSLWVFVADTTLAALYKELLALARTGKPVRFAYRCDAPAFRRLFAMRINLEGPASVEFASTLRWQEARPPVALLDCHQLRNREFVRVCSWCQRIFAGGKWLSAEAAVEALGLMEADTMPALTHGICEKCNAKMIASVNSMWGAAEGLA
jgi:hypothetical protein